MTKKQQQASKILKSKRFWTLVLSIGFSGVQIYEHALPTESYILIVSALNALALYFHVQAVNASVK